MSQRNAVRPAARASAVVLSALLSAAQLGAQAAPAAQSAPLGPSESDYYQLVTIPIPEGIVLEVGGLTALPGGSLAVATRRGEVWTIDNAYAGGGVRPHFTRFAHGLHEPLGLAYRDGSLYAAQRGELTRLQDVDSDGTADRYETLHSWPLTGNYHEYSYGPVFDPQGNMTLALNLAWVGRGASLAPWRGWVMKVGADGEMTPFATGMRSPAGFGYNLEGDLFYAENQGDWVGSGFIAHVERGDFVGNPEGLRWSSEPGSPVSLRLEDIPNTGEPKHEVAERVPGLKTPAVWLPHGVLGISTSDILVDSTGGRFGPFEGQLFVGDQGHSKLVRVQLERVDGVYQGAAFPFREGFASGVLRQVWGHDGSMVVGMTNRGWNSTGRSPFALQRLVWTGRVPFEAHRVEARPDGFEITFTQPVDRATAADPASYAITGFTYRYHQTYGSPPIERETHPVQRVVVSADGRSARLAVPGLRQGFVHEIKMDGLRSAEAQPLLHPVAYYTLNRIPQGERLAGSGPPAGAPAALPGANRPPAVVPTAAPPAAAPTAKRMTTMPAAWGGVVDQTVTVGTRPPLQFTLQEIRARAGSRVRLVLNNTDDMLHNLVVTRPGRADAVGQAALALGLEGPEREYVPPTPDVLYHTALLQPGGSDTIYFNAPTEPGVYEYVCTFPGHYLVMRGVLRVDP